MTATLHQIPANRTSFDAHETLVALREIGVTERVRIFNPVFPHLVEYPRSWSGSQTTFFRHPGR